MKPTPPASAANFLPYFMLLALCSGYSAAAETKPASTPPPSVGPGMHVAVEYTMSDESGVTIESNKGQSPFLFVSGKGEGEGMIPALEEKLMGLREGDEKQVKLLPEEAYGPVLKEAFKEVPKDQIPPEARRVGVVLQAQSTDGRSVPVRVSQVTDDVVTIDFNHPLAGKTLMFHVKVLAVKKPEGFIEAPGPGSAPLPVEIPR